MTDSYPTEEWPESADVLALDGTTDDQTGLPFVAKGTTESSSPTLEEQFNRRLHRQNAILALANQGRVVQVDDTHFGVFPADYNLAGSDLHYPGEESVAITTTDDTYYVYLDSGSDDGSDGEVAVVTDATGWPADRSTFIPLAEITVSSNIISAITDVRARAVYATRQPYDDDLADLAALTPTDSYFIVGDGTDWVTETGATARASLGLTIGTHVQAWDAQLDDIAALAVTDGNIIVGDGANWVAESGATARASLGLTIGTHVQAYSAELAGLAALSGTGMVAHTTTGTYAERTIAGSTGITVTNGDGVAGAPSLSLAAGLVDIAGLAKTDGGFIVGDGANFVLETGATVRTSLGLTIGSDVQAYSTELAGLAALAGTGMIAHTAANTYTERTIAGDGSTITVTNGDGVAGAPTIGVTALSISSTQLASVPRKKMPGLSIEAAAQAGQVRAITCTVKDLANSSWAYNGRLQVWIGSADMGAPAAVADTIDNVAAGAIIETITANQHYQFITNASGVLTFDLTINAGGTAYVMAEIDGRVYSLEVEITGP